MDPKPIRPAQLKSVLDLWDSDIGVGNTDDTIPVFRPDLNERLYRIRAKTALSSHSSSRLLRVRVQSSDARLGPIRCRRQ